MENFLLLAILFKMRERPKKFLFEEANSKSFHKYYLISTWTIVSAPLALEFNVRNSTLRKRSNAAIFYILLALEISSWVRSSVLSLAITH